MNTLKNILSVLCALCVLCGSTYAATGDITSVEIPASGSGPSGGYALVEIEGFTTGMDFDLGDGDDEFDTDGNFSTDAHIVFTVTSQGYTLASPPVLSTRTRTVYGTIIARKASPDEADANEAATMGGVEVYVWLSEAIYDDDTATVSITAATFTNTGGSSETSAASSGLSVTNNSTLDYPEITAQLNRIDGVNYADRVEGSSFDVCVYAFAGYGIRALEVTATGQTSANVENVFTITPVSTAASATGLYGYYYKCTIDSTDFTDDELINIDYQVYPMIGDADTIVDTTSSTATHDEILGRNTITVVCDNDSDSDSIAYCSSSGDDGTGDGSMMNPYRNPAPAIDDGVNLILALDDASYTIENTHTRVTSDEWIIFRPSSGVKDTGVELLIGATRQYNCERLKIEKVSVDITGTSSWLDGEELGNHLWFDDCDLPAPSAGIPTVSPAYRSDSCVFTNCTGALSHTEWALDGFSSSSIAYHFDGCEFNESSATSAVMTNHFAVLRSTATGGVTWAGIDTATSNPSSDGGIFAFNQIFNATATSNALFKLCNSTTASGGQNNHNWTIAGNVIEKTGATSAAIQIAADGSTTASARACNNTKIFSNTVISSAGGSADNARINLAYNDVGTSGQDRINWFIAHNCIGNSNFKADTFGTPNANRTGGWPVVFGVNCHDNFLMGNASDSFRQEYAGPGTTQSVNASPNSPGFIAAASDDYTPDAGSSLLEQYDPYWDSPFIVDSAGRQTKGDLGAIQADPYTVVRMCGVYDIADTTLRGPKEVVTGASGFKLLAKAGAFNGLPSSVSFTIVDGDADDYTEAATLGASPYEFKVDTFSGSTPYVYVGDITAAELTGASIQAGQMLTVTVTATATGCTDRTDTFQFWYGSASASLEFWVDADDGDDSDDGLSSGNAKQTWRDALDETLDSVNNITDGEEVIFNLKRGTTATYLWDRPASSQTSNNIAIIVRPYGTGADPRIIAGDASDPLRVNHIVIEGCEIDLSDGSSATSHKYLANNIETITDKRLTLRDCTVSHYAGGRDGGATIQNASWVTNAWDHGAWLIGTTVTDIPRQGSQGAVSHIIDSYLFKPANDGFLDVYLVWGVTVRELDKLTMDAHLDSIQWSTAGFDNVLVDGLRAFTTSTQDQGFVASKGFRNVFLANMMYSRGETGAGPEPIYSQIGTGQSAGTDPSVINCTIVHSGWAVARFWVQADCFVNGFTFENNYAGDFIDTGATLTHKAWADGYTGNVNAVVWPAASATADGNFSATVADAPDWGSGPTLPTTINGYTSTSMEDYTPGASSELLNLTTSRYVAADMFGNSVAASGADLGPIMEGNTFGVGGSPSSPSSDEEYQNLLQRFSVERSIDGDRDGNVTVSFQIKFKATRDRKNEAFILAP